VNADLSGQSEYAEAMSQSKLALLEGVTGAAEVQKNQGEALKTDSHQSTKEIAGELNQARQGTNNNLAKLGQGTA
jgi:hypothetical protein